MEGVSSTAARSNLAERPDRSHASLRVELERDYSAAFGRAPHRKQLDWLERAAAWLLRAQAFEGEPAIRRSWPQVARGCGCPDLGTVRANDARWVRQLRRTFGYLQAMGWIDGWEAQYTPKRDSTGIVMTAGPRARAAAKVRPRARSSAG